MGTAVCQAVSDDPELELVAAVDPFHAGIDLRQVNGVDQHLQVAAGPEALQEAGAEVAVDFTEVGAARENLVWLAEQGLHAVVGTTGFTSDDLDRFRSAFTRSNCVIAPNFAIGAVLMIRFAELAAPYFDTAEIIELHHDQKIDAPSGTALLTAERMAAASDSWADDPTRSVVVEGARGGRSPAGIPIHSVRLRGIVAHQEVLLGTTGQTLDHPARLVRPLVVHAGRRAGRQAGVRPSRSDPRPRRACWISDRARADDRKRARWRPESSRIVKLPPPGPELTLRPHTTYALVLELIVAALGLFTFLDVRGADWTIALDRPRGRARLRHRCAAGLPPLDPRGPRGGAHPGRAGVTDVAVERDRGLRAPAPPTRPRRPHRCPHHRAASWCRSSTRTPRRCRCGPTWRAPSTPG